MSAINVCEKDIELHHLMQRFSNFEQRDSRIRVEICLQEESYTQIYETKSKQSKTLFFFFYHSESILISGEKISRGSSSKYHWNIRVALIEVLLSCQGQHRVEWREQRLNVIVLHQMFILGISCSWLKIGGF